MFSMFAENITAKANELNPYKYLEYLFINLPKMKTQNNENDLEEMMPWNPDVKKISSN